MAGLNTYKEEKMILMNFSGIYETQQFWKSESPFCVDAKELQGVNCYCDQEASEAIRKMISKCPAKGIHFIDSGNYHYISRIWMEKIQEPFSLVVFDNHTDMQLPAFEGLLSCGGWIADAVLSMENLKQIVLIGPDEEAYSQVEGELKKKVQFLSREVLREISEEEMRQFYQEVFQGLPVYLSIDKDILCKGEAYTTWSQGDLSFENLLKYLMLLKNCLFEKEISFLGMDVCGEVDAETDFGNRQNDDCNKGLLDFWIRNLKQDMEEMSV